MLKLLLSFQECVGISKPLNGLAAVAVNNHELKFTRSLRRLAGLATHVRATSLEKPDHGRLIGTDMASIQACDGRPFSRRDSVAVSRARSKNRANRMSFAGAIERGSLGPTISAEPVATR
jgi:hypothetical protein